MAKVLVVTSGKGGVGKTTSTAALGAALASFGQNVVVIDFDVGLRNLDLVMGAERRVVYDLSNTPYVDIAGARMLRRLHDELAGKNIEFRVSGAHSEVRDILRFEKLQEWLGPINRHVSLSEAVAVGTAAAPPGRDEGSK